MNDREYRIVVRDLWRVVEHLRSIDLDEVSRSSQTYGTEDERTVVAELRAVLPRLPSEAGKV
jgi:hypothetical protein